MSMMKHRWVQQNLYEYIAGELSAADRAELEGHIASCPRCAGDCADMRRSLEALEPVLEQPSTRRTDREWAEFAAGVERRIQSKARESRRTEHSLWESVQSFVLLHRASALAAAAACLLIIGGLLYRGIVLAPASGPPHDQLSAVEMPSQESSSVMPASERMERYFRKSKTLLVGLANMKTEPGRTVDLRAEREVSRALIKEARYLKTQDIDRRSARLIEDLNKILIELANLEDEHDVPDVEIIRGGIHQENLLFKIRMAEALNDSTSAHHDQTF